MACLVETNGEKLTWAMVKEVVGFVGFDLRVVDLSSGSIVSTAPPIFDQATCKRL